MNLLTERGQPCPREPNSRNSRTRLSALLRFMAPKCIRFWRSPLSMNRRSAGWQPAVSADWQSAGFGRGDRLRIANPRHSRLPVCATVQRFKARIVREILSRLSGTLSSILNEGKGWGEEALRFMRSFLFRFDLLTGHEPTANRSADSLVREFLNLGSRGQGCPRSERRFMERAYLWTSGFR